MTDFSFGQAFGSGFGLVARKPLTVLVWGLAYVFVALVPVILVMALLSPGYFAGMREMMKPGGDPSVAQSMMMASGAGFLLAELFSIVWSLFVAAVMTGAIYRAVLEPEDSRTFYIRAGRQELWLAVLYVAMYMLFTSALVAIILPVAVIVAVLAVTLRDNLPAVIAVGALLGLGVTLVVAWFSVRLSLAPAMTFADRQFRLFESWTLTRGMGWKLVGLVFSVFLAAFAALMAVYAVIVVVAVVVGLVAFGGSIGAGGNPFEAMSGSPAAIPLLVVFGLLGLVFYAFLVGSMTAVLYAPFANVYKQLRPSAQDVF